MVSHVSPGDSPGAKWAKSEGRGRKVADVLQSTDSRKCEHIESARMPLNPSEPTSMTLLGRAQSNDQEAWNHIVHLYGPLVVKWCHRSGLNEDDTADVFQETFRAGIQHSQLRPDAGVGSFRSWLRSIAGSKIADHFRKLKRQPVGKGGTDAHLAMANTPDPLSEDDESEAAQEHALIVQRAMEIIKPEFDPRNFEAFKQVALEGRPATEVAAELDVSPQVIRQANYRIRRRLRSILEGLVDEGQ